MIGRALRLATTPHRAALGLALDTTLGEAGGETTYTSRTAPAGPPPGCEDRWDYARGSWKAGRQ